MKVFARATALGMVSATMFVVMASGASAHIEPDPRAAQAGTATTIAFDVEHGCTDSPTTALAFKLPTGVTNAKAVDKAGWTTESSATEVRFIGGSLDAHTPDHFDIAMTLPTTPGTVHFSIAQTCATGSLSWLDIAEEGKPEPDYPAAALKITSGAPTLADLAVPPDDATTADKKATSHTARTVTLVIVGALVVVAAVGGLVVTRKRRTPSAS